jgi:hypothetical protein
MSHHIVINYPISDIAIIDALYSLELSLQIQPTLKLSTAKLHLLKEKNKIIYGNLLKTTTAV